MRANQPTVSYEGARGATPAALSAPCEGRRPKRPQCAAGTPPDECVHTFTFVAPFMLNTSAGDWWQAEPYVDLHQAKPHVHAGAISLRLEDAETDETLCFLSKENGGVIYGVSAAAGDEAGYIVGSNGCVWSDGQTPRLRVGQPLRTTGIYDASVHQTGVMSQWQFDTALPLDARRA